MTSPDDLKFHGKLILPLICATLFLSLSLCFNLRSARFQSLMKPQISCLQMLEPQPSASPVQLLQPPLKRWKLTCQTMKTISKRVQRWAVEQNRQIRAQAAACFTCLLVRVNGKTVCSLFPQLLGGEKQTGGFWTFEYYQSFFNVDTLQVRCFLTAGFLYNPCIILKIWILNWLDSVWFTKNHTMG